MAQRWHDLLFMHWPLPASTLSPLIPSGLTLDTFDGQAWIGVIPFRMSGVRMAGLPALPGMSAFPELNVRTYVTHGRKPGVWFFSLDAANSLAVAVARRWFGLPYHRAAMRCDPDGAEGIRYTSRRATGGADATAADFSARYRPVGEPFLSRPGTLEHFLTERYCLYAKERRGSLARAEIHHAPWPLQPAEAVIELNTMVAPLRLALPEPAPQLHFVRRLDVVVWTPERLSAP